ncbi:hypothetical protein niasHT_022471 [Heterodera trifolii]|uniref:Uncharacterized protein n=1 Tax=Heterodera trifolii TaxID=157864 RepID=A0ABD2JGU7_9BILA
MAFHLSASLPLFLLLKRRIGRAVRKFLLLKQLKSDAKEAGKKRSTEKNEEEEEKPKMPATEEEAGKGQEEGGGGQLKQKKQQQQNEWNEEKEDEAEEKEEEWEEEEEEKDEWDEHMEADEDEEQTEWNEEEDNECVTSSVSALSPLAHLPYASAHQRHFSALPLRSGLQFSPHCCSLVRSVSLSSESVISVFVERFTG